MAPPLSLAVFALTLALVLVRPRGVNEAVGAAVGAGLALALGLVAPVDVLAILRETANVLLFLLGMMVVTGVAEAAGVFDALAVGAARLSGGSGRGLLLAVFALGTLVTAFLSLDVTIIVLTPIVVAATARLRIDPVPYLFAVAFVANTASLFLPVSNLTNILVYDLLGLGFGRFAAVMLLPGLAALAVNVGVFLWLFRGRLPRRVNVAALALPEIGPFFPVAAFGLGSILAALLAFGLAGQPLAVPACAGAVALGGVALVRRAVSPRQLAGGVAVSVFPFIVAMFVVIRAVERAWLPLLPPLPAGDGLPNLVAVAFGATVAANVVNNIPAVAAIIALLRAAATPVPEHLAFAALIGTNVGPSVLPVGSLATLLWLALVGRRGVGITGRDYLRVGAITTPAMVLAAVVALWLVLRIT